MSTPFLLHQLLDHSAEAAPGAAAVSFGDETLSYAALAARSTRLARALRADGVRPGDRVGLCAKKGLDAIAALLGIMKAGACAVPVVHGTPASRLTDIARQSGMRALITSGDVLVRIAEDGAAPPALKSALITAPAERGVYPAGVAVRPMSAAEALESDAPLDLPTVDRDLALVLFTSGSTGSPKGVMLSHRAVKTFVDWGVDAFDVRAEDRLSNHAPLNFDLSTFDIFGALKAGASVTLIPEALAMFPGRMAELVERERLSVWYSVPSVLVLLCLRGGLAERDLSSLRLVLFAGEVFPVRYLRRLMLDVPGARYVNLYGPTETNVCTYHEVKRVPEEGDPPVPIGRACANTRTVVLDEDGAVVGEPGREGVLHVGGSSLMDGYFGRPEETAAAFTPNPAGEGRVEPLYCTGDWVTLDADGDYRFRGRRDHMVKVGGYRIELGEVEAALFAHPAVRDAAAVPVPDDLLGSRIRAFVVVAGAIDASELRRHCGDRIPKYMVPHEIVLRDALPRTSNDKVDRTRLEREP